MNSKLGLFAADKIGLQVAKFLGSQREKLSFLILDSKDPFNLNRNIKQASKLPPAKIFYSDDLKKINILKKLKETKTDLVVLAWWPYILKKNVLGIARDGYLNFHPSYLPFNRGKHYYFWSIVEGSPFGVTLHFVDEKIDTGDIAYQALIDKTWEDTGESLYKKAQKEILHLFKSKYLEIRSGHIPRRRQKLSLGSFHNSSELEQASKIDLDKMYKGRLLLNILRGRSFRKGPSAWFRDGDKTYEVRVQIKEKEMNK